MANGDGGGGNGRDTGSERYDAEAHDDLLRRDLETLSASITRVNVNTTSIRAGLETVNTRLNYQTQAIFDLKSELTASIADVQVNLKRLADLLVEVAAKFGVAT